MRTIYEYELAELIAKQLDDCAIEILRFGDSFHASIYSTALVEDDIPFLHSIFQEVLVSGTKLPGIINVYCSGMKRNRVVRLLKD